MDTPGTTPQETALRELLMEACVIISSFRVRLSNAGYPFPEPPRAKSLISEIDAVMYPPESQKKNRAAA